MGVALRRLFGSRTTQMDEIVNGGRIWRNEQISEEEEENVINQPISRVLYGYK